MTWVKKGLLFKAQGQYPFMQTHTQVPLVEVINEDRWRIYFSTRDSLGRSRPTYIEVNAHNPVDILYHHPEPLLELGEIGTFDDCGVMATAIINQGSRKLMYYTGWNVRNTVPYHNSIGLAISEDGGKTFQRFSQGPLLASTYNEPYFVGLAAVLKEEKWRMWYSCCTGWHTQKHKPEAIYRIHYAESDNGIDWHRSGQVALDYFDKAGNGLSVSSVFKEDNLYHMVFCYRKPFDYHVNPLNSYKIGYAISEDGLYWQRQEDILSLSDQGWDSLMLAYPFMLPQKDAFYLFYNGNDFGKSGLGLAVKHR